MQVCRISDRTVSHAQTTSGLLNEKNEKHVDYTVLFIFICPIIDFYLPHFSFIEHFNAIFKQGGKEGFQLRPLK